MNDNTNTSKQGSLNPMWGKRHDELTKRKISDSQKKRYAQMRKAMNENSVLKYAQTDSKAVRDVLKQLLDNNELSFKTVQQAVNFLAIMLQNDRIKTIVDEEINRFRAVINTYGTEQIEQN